MRQENREARARHIEASAYELLEEKGFAGLSVQAVAKAAKASNETLYKWYGDKTGLFEALIRGNTGLVAQALEAAAMDNPIECLRRVGPVLLTMLLGDRAVALNRAAAADASGTLGRTLAREGRSAVAPRIIGIMEIAISEDALANGTPQEMAETFFALLIGDLQIRRVTGALPKPHDDYILKRSGDAVASLTRLFPPRDLDESAQSEYL